MRYDPHTHVLHAAGRTWQADPTQHVHLDTHMPDVRPTYVHHVRMALVRFESGWSASIIWGSGTYSTNHDAWHTTDPFTEQPNTVEVGVIDHTGELRMRRQGDDEHTWHDVHAYLDDAALAALLDRLATLPTDYDYGARPPTMDELYDSARAVLGVQPPPPP